MQAKFDRIQKVAPQVASQSRHSIRDIKIEVSKAISGLSVALRRGELLYLSEPDNHRVGNICVHLKDSIDTAYFVLDIARRVFNEWHPEDDTPTVVSKPPL